MARKNHNLRRRSNWYIYLISFAATFLLLCLVVLAFRDILFPGTAVHRTDPWNMNYVPDSSLDVTVLFMLGNEQGGTPRQFMLMNYRPADGNIVLVPLNADTKAEAAGVSGRLTDLHGQGGAALVAQGLSKTLGIECKYYVHFSRNAFNSFTSDLGEMSVNLPFSFTHDGISFPAGDNKLTGSELFLYVNNADFPSAGENHNAFILSSALTFFINNNLSNLNIQTIQDTFNKILNNATTNLSFSDYRTYQQALEYTSKNSANPASFYLPSGSRNAQGEVELSNQAIADIISRFGLNTF
jgi:anionic cell wall polymer biosynthesis LytR-Cps2A-Psr (LCP) family protein